jgi:hypothetical protein
MHARQPELDEVRMLHAPTDGLLEPAPISCLPSVRGDKVHALWDTFGVALQTNTTSSPPTLTQFASLNVFPVFRMLPCILQCL